MTPELRSKAAMGTENAETLAYCNGNDRKITCISG